MAEFNQHHGHTINEGIQEKFKTPNSILAAEFKPQKMAALNLTFKIFRAQSKPKRKGLHKHYLPQTNILADSNTSCAEINVPANPFSLKNQKNSSIKFLTLKNQKVPAPNPASIPYS
ncbi:hypothetical protein L6164_017084 [Bauhinia variegata]|uniref:Uncharacterized protein n=1 Tax=Bauhinia variegata TaxID=167791 RepID=A0ACB9N6Z6_BAUVA|nr:hypothetical protein L6164_017084 [Bauhinia variegata]